MLNSFVDSSTTKEKTNHNTNKTRNRVLHYQQQEQVNTNNNNSRHVTFAVDENANSFETSDIHEQSELSSGCFAYTNYQAEDNNQVHDDDDVSCTTAATVSASASGRFTTYHGEDLWPI